METITPEIYDLTKVSFIVRTISDKLTIRVFDKYNICKTHFESPTAHITYNVLEEENKLEIIKRFA